MGSLLATTFALAAVLAQAVVQPEAHAQTCTFSAADQGYVFTGAQAAQAGFRCEVGQATFTDFRDLSGTELGFQFKLSQTGDMYKMRITSDQFLNTNPATFSYDVLFAGTEAMELATRAGSQSVAEQDLSLQALLKDGTHGVIATYTNTFGTITEVPGTYGVTEETITLKSKLSMNSPTSPDTWVQTIKQTPSPLGVLGAGAAFGWCRRMRRRLQSRP